MFESELLLRMELFDADEIEATKGTLPLLLVVLFCCFGSMRKMGFKIDGAGEHGRVVVPKRTTFLLRLLLDNVSSSM